MKSRWREFLVSPHHAALALATLGAGFLTAEPLYFIAGAAAYVVGWIFLPDSPFFRRYRERKDLSVQKALESNELAEFNVRRAALIDGLTPARRERYFKLADVCKGIEETATDSEEDLRIRKIEELMWTYLRLLTMEESLEEFLESEARDDVQRLLADAQEEVNRLKSEVARLQPKGSSSTLEAKERLLTSRLELLETIGKRADRLEQARANLALVSSEQQRLDQQIKLLRADSIATHNAAVLSARIDATVENLEHTNKWLSELDQFRDLLGDVPLTAKRAGFGERASPPPVPQRSAARGKERT
jgi:hypothetical protein